MNSMPSAASSELCRRTSECSSAAISWIFSPSKNEERGDAGRNQGSDEVLPHLFGLEGDPLAVADDDEPFFQIFRLGAGGGAGGPGAFDDDVRAVVGFQRQFKGDAEVSLGFFLAVDGVVNQVGLGAVQAEVDGFHERGFTRAVHAADQEDAFAVLAGREENFSQVAKRFIAFNGQPFESHG
jgi:hypothetical protein